jgi:L-asparaginase / beta-aspartyl-peptidase
MGGWFTLTLEVLMPQAIIVHGGAWAIPDGLVGAHREACLAAVKAGWSALQVGGAALDAIEQAILVMEDHPDLDAGRGSFLNANGQVELDAGMMDGTTLAVGSVAAVQGVRHPISLARKVMESEHVLLVGSGAEQFAQAHGVERCPPAFLVVPRELERWNAIRANGGFPVREAFVSAVQDVAGHASSLATNAGDTVGAVALDGRGNIAVGTSTGGTVFKSPGRVGDSPLVGCGYYADSQYGGASCTGWGEAIMRLVLAKSAVDRLAQSDSAARTQSAARWAIHALAERVDGLGGIIMLDCCGNVGYAFNTPRMAYAYLTQGMDRPVFGI